MPYMFVAIRECNGYEKNSFLIPVYHSSCIVYSNFVSSVVKVAVRGFLTRKPWL